MVEFDGMEIERIAPVRIIDIVNAAPDVQTVTQSMPLQDGQRFIRRTRGARVITVTFVLLEQDAMRRRVYIAALTAWLGTSAPAKLRITPEPTGYLMALCTLYPGQSSREYWEILQIQFTAYDPAFIALDEYRQPVTLPVTVMRSEPPIMRIEQHIASPLTSPTWTLGTQSIVLSGSVGVGDLVIDFEWETVTLNGASIMDQMTMDSRFFALERGANQIVTSNGAGGALCWRERWL